MTTPAHKMTELEASPEYAAARKSYCNRFVNGAGMQKPGSCGFALWLIYSNHLNATGTPTTKSIAVTLAKEYGLNVTSAENALGKWSAYYGFRPARTGAYAVGPS